MEWNGWMSTTILQGQRDTYHGHTIDHGYLDSFTLPSFPCSIRSPVGHMPPTHLEIEPYVHGAPAAGLEGVVDRKLA